MGTHTFRIDRPTRRLMEENRAFYGCGDSDAELFGVGLRMLELVADAREQGRDLAFIDRKDGTVQRIVFPGSENYGPSTDYGA